MGHRYAKDVHLKESNWWNTGNYKKLGSLGCYQYGGDLQSYLQKKGHLKPHKALRLALDIARGMNYLHECKPDPIIHLDLRPKNILLDRGNQLKVAGFGLLQITKVSPDKAKLAQPDAKIHRTSLYMAPEVYKDEIFDRSADAFSFGLILYEVCLSICPCLFGFQMIEGVPAFHPKAPEDASKMICLEGLRPSFRSKSKSYPPDVKELIEGCWDPDPVVRPTFSEIIIRLDKTYAKTIRQGWWKDNFKLPWYVFLTNSIL
ncbi:hypothetical protein Taro_036344 [Colocasia esculenta]|uniref:Protein kinase domain-containing protein n=1 Tax=Colocasia esculenta TaxID=4460 RepID=A0A843W2V2_COLES|nr:hypothetical protein [Colocasia esculenta]